MHNTNVITIEKNIPMPEKRNYSRNRYTFLKNMEIGDSFVINGNMPDYKPGCSSTLYAQAKDRDLRISIRTEEGPSDKPTRIRVWRTE